MKIGIYSPYLDTLTGGEKYIFTAASCLSKEHQVDVFWNDPSIIERASAKFGIDLNNVRVSENIFSKNINFFKRYIHSLRYDRIFYLSDGSIPLIGCKLLVHFQFPVQWVNTNSFLFLYKKSRIKRFICNSYFTKGFIDKKFGVESDVLYPPAGISKSGNFKKQKLILTVGRFSQLPNGTDFKKLNILIDSFKKFQKKRLKGWKLVIVTSVLDSDEEAYKKFEDSIKSDYITVVKNADYKTIKSLYEQAMIYWHAAGYGEDLIKNPERAEHFGISTVEAMSYGLVPVVINAGGQPEIIREGENGFLWDSIEDLIKKTHRIAVDKVLYNSVQANAISSSQKFSIERFCEELNHLIW